MRLKWKQGATTLTYSPTISTELSVECSCNVRNEINGLRKPTQIVRTMPHNNPYMPRIFPKGVWIIGIPEPRTAIDRAPYFIPTNAYQFLPVWDIANGAYVQPSTLQDKDEGYGIHFSEYETTLGCVKIEDKNALLTLVQDIVNAQRNGDIVYFEVI